MFLPTTLKEVRARGWDQLDVILFTGDAYIDHPSFGAAVVGRLLEAEGYRVAIVPQPNWRDDLRDFTKARHSAPLLRRDGRGDGFDGEPLYRQHPVAQQRCLHARRESRIPPRLCGQNLYADSQAALSAYAGGHRRYRGFIAPPDPLRLLERFAPSSILADSGADL